MKKLLFIVLSMIITISICSCNVKYVGTIDSLTTTVLVETTTQRQYVPTSYSAEVYQTADWRNYQPSESSEIAEITLELPKEYSLTDSIIYDENGKKAGEILPIVKLFDEQTVLETYLVKYTGEKPNEIQRRVINFGNSTASYIENEVKNNDAVWYSHTYYVAKGTLVGIVAFYSDEKMVDDDTQAMFEHCASSIDVVMKQAATLQTNAVEESKTTAE